MGPPIIIIGAGRSGTKILRSILSSHPDLVCFPREINYIWRFGNANWSTDELRPEHARPRVTRYIRRRFETFSSQNNGKRVVEKTCANSLRVDFVHTVFPGAYFIHLVRDGRSVAESSRRCWQARPELKYLLEKLRWVPIQDVPHYGVRFLRYQLGRFNSEEPSQASWGPRFTGLDELVKDKNLIEICGLQWTACVQAADHDINSLPSDQTIMVRYEDMVSSPESIFQDIFQRLDLDFTQECRSYVKENVKNDFLTKWKKNLSKEDIQSLLQHIGDELVHFGYEM